MARGPHGKQLVDYNLPGGRQAAVDGVAIVGESERIGHPVAGQKAIVAGAPAAVGVPKHKRRLAADQHVSDAHDSVRRAAPAPGKAVPVAVVRALEAHDARAARQRGVERADR